MRQVRSALDENKRLRKELAAQAGAPAEVTNEAAQAAERISRAGGRCLDPNLDPIAV